MEHYISISGGKDSTALLLEAMERGFEISPFFCDTGNEDERVYDYVARLPELTGCPPITTLRADFSGDINRKRQFVKLHWPWHGVPQATVDRALELLKPSGNPFLDLCMWKGRFPSAKARFCTEHLKIIPMNIAYKKALDAGKTVVSWQGVRAEESYARSLLPKLQRLDVVGPGRLYAYRPLIDWTIDDVWNRHRRSGIEPNPLYSLGMKRVGCMPCIMCRKDEMLEISKRFPEHVERIAEWEAIVSDVSKWGCATFFAVDDDPALRRRDEPIHHSTHGIKNRVEWAKTGRGGLNYDLFRVADTLTACDAWGVCE